VLLVLAAVSWSGAAHVPLRAALAGAGALTALAAWAAASAAWAPLRAPARDEALLIAVYAGAFLVPALTLRTARDRAAAAGAVVAGCGLLAVATALELAAGADPGSRFAFGRLYFPIGYANAQAALFLVGFWPAVALAARRSGSVVGRGLALGAAAALLSGWVMAQSKGGALGLAVSAAVFFAVAPQRLRPLLPAAVAGLLAAAGFGRLTDPFDAPAAAVSDAVRTAGWTALALTAAGFAAGVALAAADRRLRVPERVAQAAGAAVVACLFLAAAGGAAAFAVSVDRPDEYLEERWESFKTLPERETGSTHLLSLGSNRYDFWRVAVAEARRHPVQGAGARGFGPVYLREGRSTETPARAHSLVLEVPAELGLVGAALLAVALAAPLALAARRARRRLVDAAVLAGAAYWLAHAAVDWNWTFPAVGLPFFVLLGIGASGGRRPLRGRRSAAAGAVAVGVAALALAPPWLSARLTERALERQVDPGDALAWARRLDPLAVEPLLAEADLAATPAAALPPLERAVEREPESLAAWYALGVAALEAGRPAQAGAALERASALDPGNPLVEAALARARGRPR
jgi:hypothetical protein